MTLHCAEMSKRPWGSFYTSSVGSGECRSILFVGDATGPSVMWPQGCRKGLSSVQQGLCCLSAETAEIHSPGSSVGKTLPFQYRECRFDPWCEVKVAQSCPTLCDPMDYIVHGILQARILEWVAFPFSRGSSQPRDWTQVSRIEGRFFTIWATREALNPWLRN